MHSSLNHRVKGYGSVSQTVELYPKVGREALASGSRKRFCKT